MLCLFVVAAVGFGWFGLGYFGFLVSFVYLICLCCALVGLVLVAWIRCFLGHMSALFGFDVVLVAGLLRLVLIGLRLVFECEFGGLWCYCVSWWLLVLIVLCSFYLLLF